MPPFPDCNNFSKMFLNVAFAALAVGKDTGKLILALAAGYVIYTQRDKIKAALDTISNPGQAAQDTGAGIVSGATSQISSDLSGLFGGLFGGITNLFDNAKVSAYNAQNDVRVGLQNAQQNAQLALNRVEAGVVYDSKSGLWVLPQFVGHVDNNGRPIDAAGQAAFNALNGITNQAATATTGTASTVLSGGTAWAQMASNAGYTPTAISSGSASAPVGTGSVLSGAFQTGTTSSGTWAGTAAGTVGTGVNAGYIATGTGGWKKA